MNIELPPFLPGDRVIYITGIHMPKNSIHTVSDVWKELCRCGWVIAIDGYKRPAPKMPPLGKIMVCGRCRERVPYSVTEGDNAWNPKSFRKISEVTMPLMTFSKILETEKTEILIPN